MIDKVKASIRKYNMIPEGSTVVAAVSGGSDSMALLSILNSIKDDFDFRLCAAHVNHCLRGENADRDENFVREKCRASGVELFVKKARVAEIAAEQGIGLEECGRKIRYDFFNSLGENIIIATAHNLSDRAETFLFNFARGSALRGLCSIPPVRENIVRPLIDCSKTEIIEFCKKNQIEYVTDETNSDVKYSRNRIRHNVITELEKINPSFEKNASRCITSLSEDEAFLSSLATGLAEKSKTDCGYDAAVLLSAPKPVLKRAIIRIIENSKTVTPEYKFIEKICALLEKGGNMQINGGITIRVRKGVLDFPNEFSVPENVFIDGKTVSFGDAVIESEFINNTEINNLQIISKQDLEYYLDCDKIHGKVIVRGRKEGDKITLASRRCTKSLKKLFNELEIPPEKRNSMAVFADDEGIILVEGAGCSERVSVKNNAENLLKIKIIREN